MAVIPQHQSIVIVYSTTITTPSDANIEKAIGSPIRQRGTAEGGRAWAAVDGTTVVVRPQGSGQYRIEVRDPAPAEIDHRRARDIALRLSPRTGAKPHSVGVNCDMLIIDPSPDLVASLVDIDDLGAAIGGAKARLASVALTLNAVGAQARFDFQSGTTVGMGTGAPILSIRANYTFAAASTARLKEVLADTSLKKADAHLKRALSRIKVQ